MSAIIESVAQAIASAHSPKAAWSGRSEDAREVFRSMAVAAINEMGAASDTAALAGAGVMNAAQVAALRWVLDHGEINHEEHEDTIALMLTPTPEASR